MVMERGILPAVIVCGQDARAPCVTRNLPDLNQARFILDFIVQYPLLNASYSWKWGF